jgi:hypothetical protein
VEKVGTSVDKYFRSEVAIDTNKVLNVTMNEVEQMNINMADKKVDCDIDGAHYLCAECGNYNISLTYGDDWGTFYEFTEPEVLGLNDKGIICEWCAWKAEQVPA